MSQIPERVSGSPRVFQNILKLSVVTHAYNPSTWRLRQEDHNFKSSQSYKVKPHFRNSHLKLGASGSRL
jgi:hypothetical protein